MIKVVFSLWAIPSSEKISNPNVRAFIRQLSLSKRRPVTLTGLAGKCIKPITKAAMPIGILMANSQCHEPKDRMTDAMVGPAAIETATTRALIPMPRPRKRLG